MLVELSGEMSRQAHPQDWLILVTGAADGAGIQFAGEDVVYKYAQEEEADNHDRTVHCKPDRHLEGVEEAPSCPCS